MKLSKPKIGISACLIGQPVRHNGSYFRHEWIADVLAKHVEVVPVCPEMAMGLGSPRESMRLLKTPNESTALVGCRSQTDFTEQGLRASSSLAQQYGPQVDAFVLAPKSPTCGVEHVRLYSNSQNYTSDGQGLFAQEMHKQFPNLLLVNAGRLFEEDARKNFLTAIFSLARFRESVHNRSTLQAFHRSHKFLLNLFSICDTKELGQIAAGTDTNDLERYREKLCLILRKTPTRGTQVNALEHLFGFMKKFRSREQSAHLLALIARFRTGELSMDLILQLLKFENSAHKISYLEEQYIFEPFPNALA